LQRLNIPSRFVYFESENHWVLKPQNSLRWHEEVFKWIGEWTGEEKKEL
jgi:dipeptidyl aminopeptidase/acylaminoacyl peptidase